MAATATAPPTAKSVVDQLRYTSDTGSAKFKMLVHSLQKMVSNPDFAEDFFDHDGLGALLDIIKSSSGNLQSTALGVLRNLCVYHTALDSLSESPEMVDKIWHLLALPGEGQVMNLGVAKSTIEVLIVLVGHMEDGHKLVNNSAKHKVSVNEEPYQVLVPLISASESLCVSKTLTFINIMMTKKKERGEDKAKKFLIRLKQSGVLGQMKRLVYVDDEAIREKLSAFQKITNFTIPGSVEEAAKFRKELKETEEKLNRAQNELFVFQQQQAKIRILKNEYAKAQETIKALSLAVPSLSKNFHPTKRFTEGGGLSLGQLASIDKRIEPVTIDPSPVDAMRMRLLDHFLSADDIKDYAEKKLGPRRMGSGGGGGGRSRAGFDFGNFFGGYDDIEDAPPPPPMDDIADAPPPAWGDDEPPPPDDDDEAPPPDDDDEDFESDLPPDEDDAPPPDDGSPRPPRQPKGKKTPKRPKTHGEAASPAPDDSSPAAVVGGATDATSPPAQNPSSTSGGEQSAPAASLGEALVASPETAHGNTAPPPPPPPLPPKPGGNIPVPPPPPGNLPPMGKGIPPPPPKFGAKPGVQVDTRQWYHGPAPTKKMKPLHWEKVPEAVDAKNTIWQRVHDKEGGADHEFDYEEFESMFSQKEVATKTKPVEEKPKKVMLLDDKIFMNLSIMLHKLPTIPKIQRAIMELDGATLDPSMLGAMLSALEPKVLPPEEIKRFVSRQGEKPVEEYEAPEQFLSMVLAIPEFRRRVQAWNFTFTWEENIEHLLEPIRHLHDALNAVLTSKHLAYFLGLLLGFGNMMNHGNARKGNAPAFHLSLLSKLDASKDNRGKVSILQHLLQTAAKRNPDSLELHEELKPLLGRVPKLEDVEKQFHEAEKSVKIFRANCEGVKKQLTQDGTVDDDPFSPTMATFLVLADKQLQDSKASLESLKLTCEEVCKFLAYQPGSPPEEMLKELTPFVEKVGKIAVEAAKEKKRAARRGQKLDQNLDDVVGKLEGKY